MPAIRAAAAVDDVQAVVRKQVVRAEQVVEQGLQAGVIEEVDEPVAVQVEVPDPGGGREVQRVRAGREPVGVGVQRG